MARKPLPAEMPLNVSVGERYGSGQDNAVYRLIEKSADAKRRVPLGLVLKVNHEMSEADKLRRGRHLDEREAVWRGLQYKKNKYEMLKMFLGEFIPDTSFVLANVHEGVSKKRSAEYTLQKEVPRVSLGDLSEDQKTSPMLKAQVVELMKRLKYMYGVLGEVNARTSNGVSLDGKLDLGGVSDFVRAEMLDHEFNDQDAQKIIDENSSPNLLVDPGTMQLSCIDFDQGQWTEGMDEAKHFAEAIVERDGYMAKPLGNMAIQTAFELTS